MMKVAVIGVGSMGKNHARVFSELPGAELSAVADSDHALARVVGDKHGVHAYSDYRQMLKSEAVSIAVPTAMHEEVGMAALESGAHVMIEKPIAATIESGKRLIDKAQSIKRQLMIGHIVRFNPAIQALKQKLVAGELGRIFQIFCRRAGPFPARIRDVGVVIDLAPHDLDTMRFLSGREPSGCM
jgi:predicted dehydrogenase